MNKYILFCLCWLVLAVTVSADELTILSGYGSPNRVLTICPKDATDTIYIDDNFVRTVNAKFVVSEESTDALGNDTWSILYNGAGQDLNLIALSQHDASGHAIRQWNPAPMSGNQQLSELSFQSVVSSYYADNRPYIEQTFETGKGRPLEQRQAGESYAAHPSSYSYDVNGSNEVIKWQVTDNGLSHTGYWQSGTLSRTTISDSEGATISVYKDMVDRALLRRTADGDTYYVYDDFGRLRYILPPLAIQGMGVGDFTDDTEAIRLYGYVYSYNRKGLLVEKRMPGCAPIYMEYDEYDRLQYIQDGNQRQRGDYWLCIEYDSYGRITLEKEINKSNPSYQKMLKEKFYDDYSCLLSLTQTERNALSYAPYSYYGTNWGNSSCLPTAEITYSLNNSSKRVDAWYYDKMGRCVQKRTCNPYVGNTIEYVSYYFDGSPKYHLIDHCGVSEKYTYQYDNLGRATQTYYKFDGESSILLSECVYDNVGHLAEYRRDDGRLVRQDSVDVRGNLRRRFDGDFTERLYYADDLPEGVTPHYNGLISAIQVKQSAQQMMWKYSYDESNRLVDARVGDKFDGYTYREQFTYDAMGNIEQLHRSLEDEPLDDLHYHYRGNQVADIEDFAGCQNYYNTKEYADLSAVDTTMRYDDNGNLLYDFDRNICIIKYNLLNLPDTIQFGNGNMLINEYDASGRKTAVHRITLAEPLVVPMGVMINLEKEDYTDRITYYSDNVEIAEPISGQPILTFHNAEGYTKYCLNDASVTMSYYVRDHLGNVCAVWDSDALSYTQRMWYYATGLPINISINQGTQPYKYNGKLYEEMEGFDVYDYGFRGYYATAMRFTSIDPLAEQTPWQSPYAYAANNPICNIDWMGLSPVNMNNNGVGSCNYIVINNLGEIIGIVEDENDKIYLSKNGIWNKDEGTKGLTWVGYMSDSYEYYFNLQRQGEPAHGFFFPQICIHSSFGIQMGYKDRIWSIAFNAMSYELIEVTWDVVSSEFIFDHLFKNGLAEIESSLDVLFFSMSQSFKVDLRRDLCYKYGTYEKSIGLNLDIMPPSIESKKMHIPSVSYRDNGKVELSWGVSFIFGAKITISYYSTYNPSLLK